MTVECGTVLLNVPIKHLEQPVFCREHGVRWGMIMDRCWNDIEDKNSCYRFP